MKDFVNFNLNGFFSARNRGILSKGCTQRRGRLQVDHWLDLFPKKNIINFFVKSYIGTTLRVAVIFVTVILLIALLVSSKGTNPRMLFTNFFAFWCRAGLIGYCLFLMLHLFDKYRNGLMYIFISTGVCRLRVIFSIVAAAIVCCVCQLCIIAPILFLTVISAKLVLFWLFCVTIEVMIMALTASVICLLCKRLTIATTTLLLIYIVARLPEFTLDVPISTMISSSHFDQIAMGLILGGLFLFVPRFDLIGQNLAFDVTSLTQVVITNTFLINSMIIMIFLIATIVVLGSKNDRFC